MPEDEAETRASQENCTCCAGIESVCRAIVSILGGRQAKIKREISGEKVP